MAVKITREMDLEDVARVSPKAIGSMTRREIVCIQCGTPLWKTVEEAMRDSGVKEEEIDALIDTINNEVEQRVKAS
ncbi:hypothetical protein GF324_11955 [bacterium]|nr:hypothetical protein [bacterium]